MFGNLKEYMMRFVDHCIPLLALRRIMAQCLAALAYLHERSIIHRDLKEANIMVADDSPYVKVVDFGTAMKTGDPVSTRTRGTRGYRAPEVCERIREKPYTI